MKVTVNNKQLEIAEDLTLCDLLKQLDYRTCAVIVNGTHILLKNYSSLILNENDNIMLVRILSGG